MTAPPKSVPDPIDLAAIQARVEEDRHCNILGFDICDNCGRRWAAHDEDCTTADRIALLALVRKTRRALRRYVKTGKVWGERHDCRLALRVAVEAAQALMESRKANPKLTIERKLDACLAWVADLQSGMRWSSGDESIDADLALMDARDEADRILDLAVDRAMNGGT